MSYLKNIYIVVLINFCNGFYLIFGNLSILILTCPKQWFFFFFFFFLHYAIAYQKGKKFFFDSYIQIVFMLKSNEC